MYLEDRRQENRRQDIREARWDIDLHHPVLRKLVNESHNVFVHVQKIAKETSGAALHPHIVKASKHYRSLLKTYSNELRLLGESTIDEDQKRQYENTFELLELSELIWGLCEILFIDNPTGGLVITQLIDWLRLHDGYGDHLYSEVIQEEAPDQHPQYWDAVCIIDTLYRLVLQGQIDKVRKLLSCHSARNIDTFTSMDDLLKKMPMYANLYRGHSVAEFDMKWRHWKDECERRLEENEFSLNKNLEDVARILCGDEAVFKELSDCCGSWYFMMVSKMLYQNPTVKSIDLQYCVQSCMDAYRNTTSPMGELDNILLSAIEFDIHQVIKDSCAMFTNCWFVAHLTDLLHHCGQLEAHKLQFGSSLKEFLLLEYASSLMSHKSLWIVGVNYLDNCPEFGRFWITLLTDALPLLEANELIFNTSDTFELMHCLEELTREDQITKRKENQPQVLSEADKEKLGLLWLGLNRNLQRATIGEGTVKLT
ncbi:hypothetical protein KUTeg_003384 [Tegillarca granosa]|uniref:Nuclear pore complex protein Nup85 n=1 Tax=Tegillarca granosa TaxID=220873 RepID=A0ABQ9FLZ7_TEGGR|nr:hypothetical protein KUTeg_003384 [Tegillarca granosa]